MQNKIKHFLKYGKHNAIALFTFSLIILVITLKIKFLVGEGFLYFPDEYRYTVSKDILFNLMEGNYKESVKLIHTIWARPASAVLLIIPNVLQFLASLFNKEHMYMPINTIYLLFFNIVIQTFTYYFIYKISKLFFRNHYVSFLSIIIFQSLDASFKYLQHGFPYDLSILIFLKTIYNILLITRGANSSNKKLFFIGLLAMLGFSTYPGNGTLYFFSIIIFLHFCFIRIIRFKQIYFIGLGSFVCYMVFEIFALLSGKSYLYDLYGLSKIIIQGSFEESLSFIFKYLLDVEGVRGVILIAGIIFPFVYILFFKRGLHYKYKDNFYLITIWLMVLYTLNGINGYFFQNSVSYGRLIQQYFPFLSIAGAAMLFECFSKITNHKNYISAFFYTLSITFTILFSFSIYNFSEYVYPRDILNSPDYIKNHPIKYVHEIPIIYRMDKCRLYDDKELNEKHTYTAVNSAFYSFYKGNIDKKNTYEKTGNCSEIFNAKHIINYRGYLYEGFTMEERKIIDELDLCLKIYLSPNL